MPRKNKLMPTDDRKELFLLMLEHYMGNIKLACSDTGINRSTYYLWCRKDDVFEQKAANVRESVNEELLDVAESNVHAELMSGDKSMTKFFLKEKGQSRGYGRDKTIGIVNPLSIDATEYTPRPKSLNAWESVAAAIDAKQVEKRKLLAEHATND
jgi:hypothetical protein